jgi:hypothetical protein
MKPEETAALVREMRTDVLMRVLPYRDEFGRFPMA